MSKTSPAQFVRQVRQELKRITWATKKDTLFATITVLLMAVLASVFFFLVDLLLSSIVEFVLSVIKSVVSLKFAPQIPKTKARNIKVKEIGKPMKMTNIIAASIIRPIVGFGRRCL